MNILFDGNYVIRDKMNLIRGYEENSDVYRINCSGGREGTERTELEMDVHEIFFKFESERFNLKIIRVGEGENFLNDFEGADYIYNGIVVNVGTDELFVSFNGLLMLLKCDNKNKLEANDPISCLITFDT